MDSAKLYYTPPEDELFEEVREKAMEVWHEVSPDDAFGYRTGKINRIKNIGNIKDNFMYMVAMFDIVNQRRLAEKLSSRARRQIRVRMLDGGNLIEYIVF